MALHSVERTALFHISESGGVVENLEVLLENRLEPAERIHKLRLRCVNLTKSAGFLGDVELVVELVPWLLTEFLRLRIERLQLLDKTFDIEPELLDETLTDTFYLIGSGVRQVLVDDSRSCFRLKEKLFQRHLMVHRRLLDCDVNHLATSFCPKP